MSTSSTMGEDGADGIGCVAAARRQYVTPSPVTSHSAMVLVQALFAGMHITASPALEYIPPVAFCALRLILALPFLGYLAHREGGRWFRGWEWFWPAPMGAAIGTAYVLIFVCNQRSGPNVTAMVQPAMPICTTLLSAALGLEKVSVGKAVGLAVATVGTATTLRVLEIEQGASLLDAVLLLTQANAYAVYVVLLTLCLKRLDAQLRADLLKKKNEKEKETELVRERSDDVRSSVASSKKVPKVAAPPGPMRFLFAATVVAEVGVAAIAAEDLVENIEWASLPPVAWGAVLYAGLASSCLAHGLNSWAISKVQGILPTVYSGVQVVFTVLFAYAFLGHPVGWDRAAGSAVTVFGVYLVSRAKFHEQHRKTSEEDDASVSDDASEMHLRVRRTSVDHIAVAVELGPAENNGVSRRNSTGLPPVASASELEAAARAEEEQEAHRARSLV